MIENKICLYKKSLFFGVFAILVILFFIEFSSATILINHTAVARFDLYKDDPDFQSAIENAKDSLHIGYGHTSHGSQITSGMFGFNTFMNNLGYPENLFSFNNGGSNGALDLEEGAGYGDGWLDHDCGYSGWDDETRYYLDGSDPGLGTADHSDVNVIMWSWCGQVDGVDIQSHYLDNMADLENEYSDVTFIYMTGHLEGHKTGDSWFDNNNAIRSWVANSNNKVLFDFADIEKYDPDQEVNYADYFADDNCDYDSDGSSPRSEDSNWAVEWQENHSNWAVEWQENHVEGQDWYSVGCAHSKSLNCNQKAKAFWYMIARLGGWVEESLENETREEPICEASSGRDCYYIDPVNGDDSNSGAFEEPWKTFGPSVTDIIQPGDFIYAREGVYSEYGDTIYDSDRAILPLTSYSDITGGIGNPIIYKSYPNETAIIDPDFQTPGIIIQGSSRQYINIFDFEIRNSWTSGIYLADNPNQIQLKNNHVYNTDGSMGANVGAIRLNSAKNVLIENNLLHDNYIHEAPGNNNNANIFLFSGTTNFTIKNNELYNSVHGIFYKHSGYGDSIFLNNFIHDLNGNAFRIASDNVTMYNNLILNCSGSFEIHIEGGCTQCTRNNRIIHNTVVDSGTSFNLHRGSNRPGAINTTIKDNIFYDCTNPRIWHYGSDENFLVNTPQMNSSNNNYFVDDLEFSFFGASGSWGDLGDYYTLIEFQNMGYEKDSFNQDPFFVNSEGDSINDFDLIENSPSIGSASDGTDIGADVSKVGINSSLDLVSICGDSFCNILEGENCDNCPEDCLNLGEVCCSGTAYVGECCSDGDCSFERECINYNCQEIQQNNSSSINECENWKTEHPEWIFCDDFENTSREMIEEGRYFEYGDDGGDFVPVDNLGIGDSIGMRTIFQQGEVGAGGMKLGFGRNPQSYMNKGIRDEEDFREIYYRMYMKLDPEWEGNPAKLSRATVFTSSSDWSQAMIAHLWSDRDYHLLLDPASCVNEQGEVMCSGYNDFDNLQWLGYQSGTTPLFNGSYDDWLCIEHHVRLNDPSQSNGLQEFWINDNLEAQRIGLDFVGDYTSYGINAVFFENYWNTGSLKDQERYWDNIVVSTERIGCLDLGNQTQYHPADNNPEDGIVSFIEIENYMNRWLNGEITIDELLLGINEWRGLN